MKLSILLISLIIGLSFSIEKLKTKQRLTVQQVIDPDNSLYIIDTRKEYKYAKRFKKIIKIKYSGSYKYQFPDHETN